MQMQRLIACACLALASTACGDHHGQMYPTYSEPGVLVGSGRVITEQRPASGFTSIAVSAGIQAVVTVGSAESLQITAEDKIAPLVEAVVADGRLTIGFRPGTMGISTSVGVVCHIGAVSVRGVDGSAGSRIQVDGLAAGQFSVSLSAGSSFTGSGSVDRLTMDLSAGSRATASSLRARTVDATLSAGSVALVRVVDALVVHASAGSVFEYLGDPAVQADTSGGSSVRRVGS